MVDRALDLPVVGLTDRWASNEHDIPTAGDPLPTQANSLTYATANPVAHNGFACPPANGEPETAPGQFVGQDTNDQQPAGPTLAIPAHLLKSAAGSQPIKTFHCLITPGWSISTPAQGFRESRSVQILASWLNSYCQVRLR